MEEYLSKTRTITNQFLHNELSVPDCIAALDAALANFIPRMRPEDIPELRVMMIAHNEILMEEMVRRSGATPL